MATKMKKCKDCGAEISPSAKTCPQCGAKQKGGAGKIILIVVIVVIVLAVIGGAAGGGKSSNTSNTNSGTNTTATTTNSSASSSTNTTADAHASDEAYQLNKKFETVEAPAMSVDGTLGYPTVEGSLKNISGKNISYAQVEVNFFDASGAQIGSSLDNINNLSADGVWKYKVQGFEKGAETFKIVGITAY